MKTTDFAALLSRYFTKYLPNERGSSPQTIDSYRTAFILYLEYMETVCGIRPEKLSVIYSKKICLITIPTKQPTTVTTIVATLAGRKIRPR